MGPAFGAQSNKRMPGQKAEKHKCKETVKEIDRERDIERAREEQPQFKSTKRNSTKKPDS